MREDALRDMLEAAFSQPGVYDAMKVYDHCQKSIRALDSYKSATGTSTKLVTTNSSNI